jgi:hypothetical protein
MVWIKFLLSLVDTPSTHVELRHVPSLPYSDRQLTPNRLGNNQRSHQLESHLATTRTGVEGAYVPESSRYRLSSLDRAAF